MIAQFTVVFGINSTCNALNIIWLRLMLFRALLVLLIPNTTVNCAITYTKSRDPFYASPILCVDKARSRRTMAATEPKRPPPPKSYVPLTFMDSPHALPPRPRAQSKTQGMHLYFLHGLYLHLLHINNGNVIQCISGKV